MKALIVMDMLNDFIDEKGPLYCGEESREMVPFIGKKIEEYRRSGDKVIYVCDAHAPDDKEFRMFAGHAVKGTKGAQVIEALKPGASDVVIEKTTVKPFYGTGLESALEEIKPEEVGVVGVCTSICIMEVVSELRVRGYKTVVYREGVADFDKKAHEFALARMEKVYGAIVE